jgi:hypothetical protein
MNQVLVPQSFFVECTVENALSYVLTFSVHKYGGSFLFAVDSDDLVCKARTEAHEIYC